MPTTLREDAHAYTRADVPWSIAVSDNPHGRMLNYLSGGGIRTFGRTIRQEIVSRRRRRLTVVAAALAVLWLSLLVF